MYKVLLIGCGNIGAQYDKGTDAIQTHAKAWHLNPETTMSIYDLNEELAREVSTMYDCEMVEDVTLSTLEKFDIISICTPTATHESLLKQSFEAKVKLIICEKPVAVNENALDELKLLYPKYSSKVLVNYIRRFQPAFRKLRDTIRLLLETEKLTNISIRYQRGFINNCSHAFDLLEFLFDQKLELSNTNISNEIYDQFDSDPTLSLLANFGNANFNVLGLSNVRFSHFEIDIYFLKHKISIKNAGDLVEVYSSAEDKRGVLSPLILDRELTQEYCLKDYMKNVIDESIKLINGVEKTDNFLTSIDLNQRMLNYIKN